MRLQRMKVLSPVLLVAMAMIVGACDVPAPRSAQAVEQATPPRIRKKPCQS